MSVSMGAAQDLTLAPVSTVGWETYVMKVSI